MTVPVDERVSEFGGRLCKASLRSLASSSGPEATSRTTGYCSDRRPLSCITGDGSYGQPRDRASGGPSYRAASGRSGLSQRGSVNRLEFPVCFMWIPACILGGPVIARPLVRRLRLCGLILARIEDHFGGVRVRGRPRLGEGG